MKRGDCAPVTLYNDVLDSKYISKPISENGADEITVRTIFITTFNIDFYTTFYDYLCIIYLITSTSM